MLRKLLCGGLLVGGLVLASNAAAATVTIGATAPPGTGNGGGCTFCEDFQTATDAAGPSYAVPAGDGGVITSWNIVSGTSASSCSSECHGELLVFRPTGTAGDYIFVGDSASETPPADGALHTYPADIVVAPGDVIGLNYTNIVAYFTAAEPSDDQIQEPNCTFTVGASGCGGLPPTSGQLMSVAATIETPSAAFTPSASSVLDGVSVSFDGSASTTAAASITDYDWNFGDGTTLDTGTTATTAHTFTTAGPHTVTLTITDSNGDTNETSEVVTASAPPPRAAFSSSLTSVAEGASVSFDGSASTSAGTITDYDWNFGDGTTLDSGTTATATHAFTSAGPHTVTLTVTNSYGGTNQTTSTVIVLAPFAGSSLSATTLSATSKGKATLDVRCSATAVTSCRDTVDLYSATGTIPTIASARRGKRAKVLGSATFTLASGDIAVEHITLDSAGRTLLKHKHFSARLSISATDAASRTATTATTVTVKLVPKSSRQVTHVTRSGAERLIEAARTHELAAATPARRS